MYDRFFYIGAISFSIDDVLSIAKEAGKAILKIYDKSYSITYKTDSSPLTEADALSHRIITTGLNDIKFRHSSYPFSYPLPILSEEGQDIPYEKRKDWKLFWMIDPLDGTKEFIKKNGEFTINVALIYNNIPVFGVVFAPVLDWLYFNDNKKAYKIEQGKLCQLPKKQEKKKFVVVASRSHLNEETRNFIECVSVDREKEFISIGSSLKLCLVAEGTADIYPRLAPTMEWDTAAADAIVRQAGKKTYSIDRFGNATTPLTYNKKNLFNPWFIVQ